MPCGQVRAETTRVSLPAVTMSPSTSSPTPCRSTGAGLGVSTLAGSTLNLVAHGVAHQPTRWNRDQANILLGVLLTLRAAEQIGVEHELDQQARHAIAGIWSVPSRWPARRRCRLERDHLSQG